MTNARLDAPGLILGEDVSIGMDVRLGSNVVIHSGSAIGEGSCVGDGCVIGKPSRRRPGVLDRALLDRGASIGSGSVICAGARIGARAKLGAESFIREHTVIGADCIFEEGCAVESHVRIGDGVHLAHHASITSFTTIEDDVFVGSFVVTTNDNTMGRHPPDMPLLGPYFKAGCRVGAHTVIVPGRTVGERATVVARSLITRDVPADTIVQGSPARIVELDYDDKLLLP